MSELAQIGLYTNKTDLKYDKFKKYEVYQCKKYEPVYQTFGFGDSYIHRFRFPNGYGAEVIKHPCSRGYDKDLFDLIVLSYLNNDIGIWCFTTEITGGVVESLTNKEVLKLLRRIKRL